MSFWENKTVLVVDDEDALREILVDEFECLGAQVYEAENGKLALAQLQSAKPDIVVSDVRMPVMDGVQFLEAAREIDQVKPLILLLSGYTDISKEEAIKKGAIALMEKPWDMDAVLNLLEQKYKGH